MSARYAVLGLLIEEPDHGYRLAQRMQARLGSPQARFTYVYRLLQELELEGLIRRVKEERRGGGSPRVVFEVTALGERDFGGWMRAPLAFTLIFEDLLVKIAVSRGGGSAGAGRARPPARAGLPGDAETAAGVRAASRGGAGVVAVDGGDAAQPGCRQPPDDG